MVPACAGRQGVRRVNSADLDSALAGILDLRDTPGTSAKDPSAHGSGFDRVSAFQDGYDNGVEKCKGYQDDEPMVLELPFNDEQDAANDGNAPYDSIVNGVPYDLEDYWTQVYPELTEGQAVAAAEGPAAVRPERPADVRRPVRRGVRAVLLRTRRLRRVGQRRDDAGGVPAGR